MQFLFERLDNAAPASGKQGRPFDLHAAVRAQVERIVAARLPPCAGGTIDAPQFGMPSVVELGQADAPALAAWAARLVRMLRQYEPRLVQPSASLAPSGDAAAPFLLVLRGSMGGDGQVQQLSFALGERGVENRAWPRS